MTTWRTAAEPQEIPRGKRGDDQMRVVAHPGNSGDIQLQIRAPDNTWVTPAATEYTITTIDIVNLPREGMPAIRVLATNDAQFHITGIGD